MTLGEQQVKIPPMPSFFKPASDWLQRPGCFVGLAIVALLGALSSIWSQFSEEKLGDLLWRVFGIDWGLSMMPEGFIRTAITLSTGVALLWLAVYLLLKAHAGFRLQYTARIAAAEKASAEETAKAKGSVEELRDVVARLAAQTAQCRRIRVQQLLVGLKESKKWQVTICHDGTKENKKRALKLRDEIKLCGLDEAAKQTRNCTYDEPIKPKAVAIVETSSTDKIEHIEAWALMGLLRTAYGWNLIDEALVLGRLEHRFADIGEGEIRFILLPTADGNLWPANQEPSTGIEY